MSVALKSRCHHDGDDRFEAFEKEILEACMRTWDDDVQANENAESILTELHRCDATGREYYMTNKGEYYHYVFSPLFQRGSWPQDEEVIEVGYLCDSKHMHPLEYMEAIDKGLPD